MKHLKLKLSTDLTDRWSDKQSPVNQCKAFLIDLIRWTLLVLLVSLATTSYIARADHAVFQSSHLRPLRTFDLTASNRLSLAENYILQNIQETQNVDSATILDSAEDFMMHGSTFMREVKNPKQKGKNEWRGRVRPSRTMGHR